MTWRLLYVRPQSESRYHANLAERGMSAYVPKETVWRGIGIRRQPAVKPLLPGYVFADLTDEELADAATLTYSRRNASPPQDGFIQALTAHGCAPPRMAIATARAGVGSRKPIK